MNWRLNDSNFTWLDRLKICKFFLNTKNFWTMTEQVAQYEKAMAEYVGVEHAVFVSSGSTANTILAMMLKDQDKRGTIVVPSTTWITSVSPFIREGFNIKFIDVSLYDYAMDLDLLEAYLAEHSEEVSCVFITSLIGYVPNISRLQQIQEKYKVIIMMDNCENTLGKYNGKNVSSYFTSTTSTYFGHQLQSVEGGFIFTNDESIYHYALMARNHGMVRSLPENKRKLFRNISVDERFDFAMLGNNFRNTNINAFIGLLDLKRVDKYSEERRDITRLFNTLIRTDIIEKPRIRPNNSIFFDVPFCIPLVFKEEKYYTQARAWCVDRGIEIRPIISGNLLRQTSIRYSVGDKPEKYPNSEYLHQLGFYVGLHSKVQIADLADLATFLNGLK